MKFPLLILTFSFFFCTTKNTQKVKLQTCFQGLLFLSDHSTTASHYSQSGGEKNGVFGHQGAGALLTLELEKCG